MGLDLHKFGVSYFRTKFWKLFRYFKKKIKTKICENVHWKRWFPKKYEFLFDEKIAFLIEKKTFLTTNLVNPKTNFWLFITRDIHD